MAGSSRANVEITASSSRLAAQLSAARAKFSSFAGAVNRGFGKALSHPVVSSSIGNIVGGVATRGLDMVIDQARAVRDFEAGLTRFGITADRGADFVDKMRGSIRGISRETAIADADILAGAQTYVDLTGDVAGSVDAMSQFARIAQASGSSVSDVATATASLVDSMGLDPRDIEAVFSGMIVQGKKGAVALRDFAGLLPSLGAQFSKFGGASGQKGIAELGAALQVVRKGFGTAAEAGTGLESLMGALVLHADKFEKAGVHIFDKDPKTGVKTMRNFSDIIDEISNSKLVKDPTKLIKAYGRKEALAAFDALKRNKQLFDDLTEAAEDHGAVQRDLSTFMESSAGRLDTAWNNIKLAIAEAMTPERITAFVSGVEDLAKKVGPLIDAFVKVANVVGDIGNELYKVGQNVRDVIGGGARGAYIEAMYPNEDFGSIMSDSPAEQARKMRIIQEADDFARARGSMITDKIGSVIGAPGMDESERVGQALLYRYAGKNKGEQMAGMEMLEAMGLAPTKEQLAEMKKQTAALNQIAAATAGGTTVKVGSEPVVKAVRASVANVTRPGGA